MGLEEEKAEKAFEKYKTRLLKKFNIEETKIEETKVEEIKIEKTKVEEK